MFGKENVSDDDLSDDDFTLRYIKNGDWLIHMDDSEEYALNGIWNKFDDNITVITGDDDVDTLGSNQFMYGDGHVENNYGYVYGNGDVTNNHGNVYGNGIVNNNYEGGVYGNSNVKTNLGLVFGNGSAENNYAAVHGNGNVENNGGKVENGEGQVNTFYGKVYGNGDVEKNTYYSKVYGNGRVKTNLGLVYGNGKIGNNDNPDLGEYHGNGLDFNVENQTINGEIIKTSNTSRTIEGNTINGNGNTINCSVINVIRNVVHGNTINGDSNIINGFRVYRPNNTIEGNIITGDGNKINPNYIDSGATSTIENPSKIYGNKNIINDPKAVVVKGTMNVFN